MITRFLSFYLVLFLLSTKVLSQSEVFIHEVHPDNVTFSDIFDTLRIVKLETNKECMLSRITTLKVDENRIFAYDNKIGKVFIFNNEGQFVKKIPIVGKGPQEVVLAKDFTLNRELNQIEILDAGSSRMLLFDYDGNYIETNKSVIVSDFERINQSSYIGYSCNYPLIIEGKIVEADLAVFNNDGLLGKKFRGIRTIPRSIRIETFSNLTISNHGDVYLVPIMENVLFCIKPSLEIEKICDFKFETKIPEGLFDSGVKIRPGGGEISKQNYPIFIRNLNVVDSIVSLTFFYKNETYRFFWNMDRNETFTVNSSKFFNDLAIIPTNGFRGVFENGVIDIIDSHKFLSYLKEKGKDSEKLLRSDSSFMREVNKVASITQDIDNPILMYYTYK